MRKLEVFTYHGKDLPVHYIETSTVNDDVECDVYEFVEDASKDLGIIRIQPGGATPLQRVLKGDKTIEGYISGQGILQVSNIEGDSKIYEFPINSQKFSEIVVNKHETMQWQSTGDTELVVYEICHPPYEDGRFLDLDSFTNSTEKRPAK